MKRKWKVTQESTNAAEIKDENDEMMCEFISQENDLTEKELARVNWICDACNAYKVDPPAGE